MEYNPAAPSSFLQTTKHVLLHPLRFFGGLSSSQERQQAGPAVLFFILCQITYLIFGSGYDVATAALTGSLGEAQAWGMSGLPAVAAAFGFIPILAPLLALMGVYVFAAMLHFLVFASATLERAGFSASVKIAAYSGVVFLFVWIPAVGSVAVIYGGIIAAIGVKVLHGASPLKSALIGIVPVLLLISPEIGGGVGLV